MPDEPDHALSQSDSVLICLPGGKFTRGLMDRRRPLEAMKPGAGLVSIGRGSIVDTDAMVTGLRGGQLAFAAMDAAELEPLPPDHPPRKPDSVLISPHDAGRQRHAVWFEENLNACLAGKTLPGAAHHGRLR